MGNSKYFDLLNDAKQYASTCLKKQEELVNTITKKMNELKFRRYTTDAFKVYRLQSKFSQLKPDNFRTNTYVYSKITSWLNEDTKNSFVKKFGTDYDGKYLFRFNNKRLSESILGKNLVKKEIYTNIIAKDKNGSWSNENPYFEEFYHPVKLTIFCDEDFDTNKKYSLKQLQKLVDEHKIILESNLQIDTYNYSTTSNVDKLITNNANFTIGKVKYSPNDCVVKTLYNNTKSPIEDIYNLPKINCIYEELMGNFNENKFNGYLNYYPNLVDCIEKEIITKLENDIITEKKKSEFIKEYYNSYVKKAIVKFKKEIDEERKEIEKLSKNNDLFL